MNNGIFGGGAGFGGSSGRKKLTVLTQGSGVFYPLQSNVFIRVILVGGGGNGGDIYHTWNGSNYNRAAGAGGGGAATVITPYFITGSVSYSVGAAAANTTLGPLLAQAGSSGAITLVNPFAYDYKSVGGFPGGYNREIKMPAGNLGSGLCGGGGQGYYSWANITSDLYTAITGGGGTVIGTANSTGPGLVGSGGSNGTGTGWPGGGGGSSLYGIGGIGGNVGDPGTPGGAASGYGAGGGGAGVNSSAGSNTTVVGGAGSGGLIIIEEF